MDLTFFAFAMILGMFVIANFGGKGGDDDEE